jgi:prepilin-type N-terminal cleavage/methylation domain-containing protein
MPATERASLFSLSRGGVGSALRGMPEIVESGLQNVVADMAGTSHSARGFTLIELLIAVAIMIIIAAIAIPGLVRARVAGNEASAIGSLRIVNSSQYSYTSSCGFGFYAPSLTALATPPITSAGDGFISNDLSTDPSTKSSYIVAMTPGAPAVSAPASCNGIAAGSLVWTYFVSATPLPGGGTRYFGMNQGGTIYWAQVPIPVTQSGAPPGALVVQ